MHWIRQRREQLKISQEELSARLQVKGFDISRATVAHWEQGRYFSPINNPEFAKALATALDIGVLDMFIRAGFDLNIQDQKAAIGAEIIHKLPSNRQDTAIVILEQLLKES